VFYRASSNVGDRGSTVVKALRYKSEGRCSIPDGVIGIFNWQSFRSHYGLEVDSASNRNEYQEYFLRVKSGRCVRLTTLPPFWAIVTKSGNLNFLEPSGYLWPLMGLIYILSSSEQFFSILWVLTLSQPGYEYYCVLMGRPVTSADRLQRSGSTCYIQPSFYAVARNRNVPPTTRQHIQVESNLQDSLL